YRQGPAFGISDVGNISVFDGETAIKKFGCAGMEGVVVIQFKDTEMNSIWFGGSSYFWHQGEKTCFKEPFNDTIFVLTGTTLTPDRILNLGNYHWDYADRFRKNKDGNIYPTQFIESKDLLFFRFITGLYNDDNRKLYDAVYNKATGEVKIGLTNDGLTDDLTGFLPFRPTTVSTSGEYAGLIPIDDIHAWFEAHKTSKNDEVLKLKKLKEDDNPVVVFYK
ncbi:MAG: 6-bladed beta-propeller, partial [Tannerella sp.]|nr:6-bladed beta-propeller [Tannerella sp.]